MAGVVALLALGAGVSRAETPAPAAATDTDSAAAGLSRQTAELVAAIEEYRASLDKLLSLREQALARATERHAARRDFYARGIVSRLELEQTERAVTAEQQKVDEARQAIEGADQAMAEAWAAEALALTPPSRPSPGPPVEPLPRWFRYDGHTAWSLLPGAQKLEQVFAARFGHSLPVSALGQTALHDRMGFDHRNALDVAVHPDSPEGQSLIEYLEAIDVPFIAYRGAVPGSASGAHIHVGLPSPRLISRRAAEPPRR